MKKKYVKAFINKVFDEEYCLTAKEFETARKLSVSKDELENRHSMSAGFV